MLNRHVIRKIGVNKHYLSQMRFHSCSIEPALELHSRAVPSSEASPLVGPDTGRNPGGRQNGEKEEKKPPTRSCSKLQKARC